MRVLCSSDLVLFFEFKHYKPSKKKISTRCFALMEAKEMMKAKDQPGVCLELSVGQEESGRREAHAQQRQRSDAQ